ncbi:uncharacterized protein ACA1_143590 [Acanthamoeba castellanii str. Neff]|uniref:SAP domain containing protein n=1 Tax=Acanthamoeba castellanii (strain ATCC 30010 / Neff) TaxID=1257118 RepID=L8HEM4_ACACF|nr:uncharacterized protein ACA1_143590 [Acanthamoeba castellanii str. Neff]ELR23979.1 hypothetical protein ACA1_143590 [Acanthamoeba castellanii str. Neff]
MEETSALHTTLGLLPPAVVIDSLRYVSARPLPKTTPQDHIRRLIKESREIGAEQFVARLKYVLPWKPTQAALLSDLVDVEEDEDDVADRLEKELKKDLTSSDPSATFKQVNGKVVKACATELMLDPSQDLEELKALLVDEIILTGMETLFTMYVDAASPNSIPLVAWLIPLLATRLPRSVLDQYCAHWKLERTGGKAGLVARLLAHLFDLDLDDQVEAAAAESDEPESDEMEVEAVAKSKPKKEQVVAAVKKAPGLTKKTKATKKTKKMKESDDESDGDDDDALSDEDDEEQEEWERSEKKKLAKRPMDGKRPLVEPIVNSPAAAKATKTGKRPDLATSRAMSPRTPAAKPAQKKALAKKKTLQLPDDMHELNVDMKESMIVRKYKMQCLKMNGLSEIGLKAALAARLHLYMLDVARQSDEENADPNCMED